MISPVKRLIPKTVILDFHDSYSHNIKHLFHELLALPLGRGSTATAWDGSDWEERVVVINVDSLSWDHFTREVVPVVDCIILGPGPGSPHKPTDFSWPTRLITEFGHSLPIFGLCLGHQGLATAFGGIVGPAAAPRHGQITRVEHRGSELFSGIESGFEVVQYNSLTVREEGLPEGLEAIAWGMNKGTREVLALRHRDKPLWGVQFHPESIASTCGGLLLSNFLELVVANTLQVGRAMAIPGRFPEHVLALSTMHQPRPTVQVSNGHAQPRWGQRTVVLESEVSWSTQSVFEGLVKGSSPLGHVWLDSARPTPDVQSSHMFNPQMTWTHSITAGNINVRTMDSSQLAALPKGHTFVDILSAAQDTLHSRTRILDSPVGSVPLGFVGYLGYEMKHVTLPLSRPDSDHPHEEQTDAEFAFASTVLSFEHATGKWTASALVRLEEKEPSEDGLSVANVGLSESEWQSWLDSVRGFFASTPAPLALALSKGEKASVLGSLKPDHNSASYQKAIEAARELLIAGEAYELCLTTQFRTALPPALCADPYPLYLALRSGNPAPYGAFFHLPQSELAILASSPERFMSIDKEGRAEMKPIKGTVRRSDDPVEDERRRKALEEDEKERAENLMIVDLCRHDLLGVCELESVQVPKLMVVESYQTVHQLVTSVVGQAAPGVNAFRTVAAAFPPGSMTGAPKLRSLKLLDQLEQHRPRGIYSGVFGYVAIDGSASFSVVIRTLVVRGDQLTLGAGGAITHLSEAEKEWEEVLVKTEAVVGSALSL